MRPERLELEGFTVFRDRVSIDFSHTDLFALVGPTGSGKSSIVDAITFALYGSVPRLRKGRVEPIVSLGAERARVRFDFTIGEDSYTAARVVHRTDRGATTAEARLEGGRTDVVGASDVTEAVEQLLGLSYEHFTKCVVLPQGEFASFLLDKPGDRQALLRELLDLDRFGRVRDLAKARAASSRAGAEGLRAQLDEMADVTEESIERLDEEVVRLDEASEEVAEQSSAAVELERRIETASTGVATRGELLSSLRSVEHPQGVSELAEQAEALDAEIAEASDALSSAAEDLEAARGRVAEAGDVSEIARRLATAERAAELSARIEKGTARVAAASERREQLDLASKRLEEEARAHERRLEDLRLRHRAHSVRVELDVGDECPVCGHAVTDPAGPAPEGLDEAIADAESARKAADAAREAVVEATAGHERDAEFLEGLVEERDALLTELGDDDRTTLAAARGRAEEARTALDRATTAVSETRRRLATATERRSAVDARSERFWSELDRLRTGVAAAGPPEILRRDLGSEWDAFVSWAGDRADSIERDLAAERTRLESMQRELDERSERIRERVAELGVAVVPDADPVVALAAHRATIAERASRMREDLERKVGMAARLEGFETDATVAGSLVRHLEAHGFERWLVEEVLAALVISANELLVHLSHGAYSLAIDGADFWVVDHLNADERRSVETLSGGETFVVSLALALSLAEHLASMSVSGTASLESVFLDEGFGTLDPETLDTVAAVIHELGARGRTVGLITHVTALAQQIPTRFEVRKVSGSSTVERTES